MAEGLVRELSLQFASQGLDIVQPFCIGSYNVPERKAGQALPDYGRGAACMALLIGNTKAMWDHFIKAVSSETELLSNENPLDKFAEQAVASAIAATSSMQGIAHEVRFSHDTSPSGFVDMLWAAQVSGLAYKNDAAHLCVHPVYGPWFALRAVVVVDVDGAAFAGQQRLAKPALDPVKETQLEEMAKQLLASSQGSWKDQWKGWLGLRDACCPAEAAKYR